MDSIKSIPKPKSRLLLFMLTVLISVITFISLQNPLEVYADGDYAGWAASLCHSTGDSNTGGTDHITNGVSYTRTGYLCYLLTADGQQTGDPAIAFQSPGFGYIDGYVWYCTSRKNHTVTSFAGGVAPWNTTPWASGGSPTHEPQIKAWFEGMTDGFQNGTTFVYKHWGYDAAKKYTQGEYILVIETLMHFQYSTASDSLSDGEIGALAEAIISEIYGPIGYPYPALADDARKWGIPLDEMTTGTQLSILQSIRGLLFRELKTQLASTIGGSGRTFVGDPVIGTVPNLLDYRDRVNCPSNPFRSYTNKVAPFSQRAIADGVAERAGFTPWPGGTSSEISDQDVNNFGLAMMIITATDPGQSTCDEPNQPTPHQPPQESEGVCTIIKSYREIMPDAHKEDRGTFHRSNLSNQIIIEDETDYKVIGWKTSTSGNTTINSLTWESSVPSLIGETGTTPSSVVLPDTHKYLCT